MKVLTQIKRDGIYYIEFVSVRVNPWEVLLSIVLLIVIAAIIIGLAITS